MQKKAVCLPALILPVLVQSLMVVVVVLTNVGNGSWAGLGALMVGMIAIPSTALAIYHYLRIHSHKKKSTLIAHAFVLALLVTVGTFLLLATL